MGYFNQGYAWMAVEYNKLRVKDSQNKVTSCCKKGRKISKRSLKKYLEQLDKAKKTDGR